MIDSKLALVFLFIVWWCLMLSVDEAVSVCLSPTGNALGRLLQYYQEPQGRQFTNFPLASGSNSSFKLNGAGCNFCFTVLYDKKSLCDHLRVEHDKHLCTLCGKIMNSRRALGFHRNANHERKVHLECPVCKKMFAHLQNKKLHMKNVHNLHID